MSMGTVNQNYWIKRGFELDVPSWGDVIENFNHSVIRNNPVVHFTLGFFHSIDGHEIEKVKPVLEKLELQIAHVYFNVSVDASGFGMHQDRVDVWYWQAHGTTVWEIDQGPTWELSPGDLVYIPAWVGHRSTALTPRIGLSMSKT
jgi:mannose-6-phosphate isomerase-like protein (cupin superfamily)